MSQQIINGWCQVGSKVLSDFYLDEDDKLRTVVRIHAYEPSTMKDKSVIQDVRIWTQDKDLRDLDGVDFKMWIKKPN